MPMVLVTNLRIQNYSRREEAPIGKTRQCIAIFKTVYMRNLEPRPQEYLTQTWQNPAPFAIVRRKFGHSKKPNNLGLVLDFNDQQIGCRSPPHCDIALGNERAEYTDVGFDRITFRSKLQDPGSHCKLQSKLPTVEISSPPQCLPY